MAFAMCYTKCSAFMAGNKVRFVLSMISATHRRLLLYMFEAKYVACVMSLPQGW